MHEECQNFHYHISAGESNKSQKPPAHFYVRQQQRGKKKAQMCFFFFVPVLSPKLNHLSMHRVEISKESLQWWIAYRVALRVQMQPGALTLWRTIVLMANFTLRSRRRYANDKGDNTRSTLPLHNVVLLLTTRRRFSLTPYVCVRPNMHV